MTSADIFEDIEIELEREIRTWLLMAEQASSEGDRWTAEIHKGRAEALHELGLWMAAHFHLPAGYGG